MPPTPLGQGSIDVSSLSDVDLAEMLRDYGVDVGPINIATRSTYERKLIKLKTGHASPPSNRYEEVDDDEDDDDDEVQIRRPPPETRKPAPILSEPPQPRMRREVQDSPFSRPNLSTARHTTSTTYSPISRGAAFAKSQPPSRPTQESKGLPLWVKLVALFTVIVLVYLIYCNMEPQAISNIPSIPNKMEV